MDEATRAQLGGAAVAVLLAILAAVRRRLKSGKRLVPRVRMRTYLSISNESRRPGARPVATDSDDSDVESRDTLQPPRKRRRIEDDDDG